MWTAILHKVATTLMLVDHPYKSHWILDTKKSSPQNVLQDQLSLNLFQPKYYTTYTNICTSASTHFSHIHAHVPVFKNSVPRPYVMW